MLISSIENMSAEKKNAEQLESSNLMESQPGEILSTPDNLYYERAQLMTNLRNAQNKNRGHPIKGTVRKPLKQVNVTCLASLSTDLTAVSLLTGKTKRTLIEEAIIYLKSKYKL